MHKITLPQMSAKGLSEMLEGAGWAKTPQDIVGSAAILDKLPTITVPENIAAAKSQSAARMADATWCDLEVKFELSEKQRETVKRCLTFWSEKSAISGGRYSSTLLLAFGLGGE